MTGRSGAPDRQALLPVSVQVGLWMLLSAFGFAGLMSIARYLSAELDVLVLAFWRNLLALALLVPWMLRVGLPGLRTHRVGLFAARSALMVASSIAMFFAVVLIPLAEVTALSFTAPLLSTVLAVLVLKEAVGPRRWIALAIGFAGTLVILRPGAAAIDAGALLALFGALTFAAVTVIGKMLARSESPELIVAYLALFSIPLSLLPALFVWQWPTWDQLPWLLLLGLCANANMYGFARSMRIGDASMAMPFSFMALPAAALIAYLAFGERPDFWTWAGGTIIFASSLYVSQREARARKVG